MLESTRWRNVSWSKGWQRFQKDQDRLFRLQLPESEETHNQVPVKLKIVEIANKRKCFGMRVQIGESVNNDIRVASAHLTMLVFVSRFSSFEIIKRFDNVEIKNNVSFLL